MNTFLHKKLSDTEYIGILYAKEWYSVGGLKGAYRNIIRAEDFVVGKWFDFHDGENNHFEGMTTIAICKKIKDAKLIYNNNK